MAEVWLDAVGFPGYQFQTDGPVLAATDTTVNVNKLVAEPVTRHLTRKEIDDLYPNKSLE